MGSPSLGSVSLSLCVWLPIVRSCGICHPELTHTHTHPRQACWLFSFSCRRVLGLGGLMPFTGLIDGRTHGDQPRQCLFQDPRPHPSLLPFSPFFLFLLAGSDLPTSSL